MTVYVCCLADDIYRPPGFFVSVNLDRLIAQVAPQITASLLFDGTLTIALNGFQTNLVS